jgi:hypothetical protein
MSVLSDPIPSNCTNNSVWWLKYHFASSVSRLVPNESISSMKMTDGLRRLARTKSCLINLCEC